MGLHFRFNYSKVIMGRVSTVEAFFFASMIGMISAQLTDGCLFTDHYCSPPAIPPIELTEKGTDAQERCYQECYNQKDDATPCKGFTVLEIGGRTTYCYLLTESCDYNTDDICFEQGKCVSGPADCTAPTTGCPKLADPVPDAANWVCTDEPGDQISGSIDPIPVGTVCTQTCPAWRNDADKTVVVESKCQSDGQWSTPENIDGTTVTYPTDALKKPSETPLACGCESLEIRWPTDEPNGYSYDPDKEEGADFICDEPLEFANDVYSIGPNNYCKLFCDGHYVATAQCLDGEWTGNPEWGFWCYTEPAPAF